MWNHGAQRLVSLVVYLRTAASVAEKGMSSVVIVDTKINPNARIHQYNISPS